MVQSKRGKAGKKNKSESKPEIEPSQVQQTGYRNLSFQGAGLNEEYDSVFAEVEEYAIFLLDLSGTIKTWNKGAEKIKGYSAQEIIGKNYRIFYTKEDKKINLSEKLLSAAKENGETSYEGWRVKKDGTRFWGHITLTALHDKDGTVKGYLKVTRDLTDRKIAEDRYSNFVEELKLRNEELKQSEERYHKMISEVMDYAIIPLDKDGKVLDWNKSAEKLSGYTPKEIIGKNFRLFYPKEEKDAGLPEKLLAEAIRKGGITHEGWRIRKDGKRFWGNITITTLRGEDGQIMGFSKVTRDLTEKKVAEDQVSNVLEALRQSNEQLKQSEERYHKMIDEVQDYAILLLSRSGVIENWNTGAAFIKGYNAAEIIGKNFRTFYTKEDRGRKLPEKLLAEAIKMGKASHEGLRVRKDGTCFWGSVVITALHSVSGDLTDKKNADDALKASAAQLDLKNQTLERLNEELSSFTHVASHDLKEPLRKIQTLASRIEDANFDPGKCAEYLNKIKSSGLRMQNLIDDLLSFSQVSNNAGKFEKVDLNKVLEAIKNDLEIPINEKRAVIDWGTLPVVYGIYFQLQQLFLNVISNSVKFSRADEPPCIEIRAEVIEGPDIPGGSSREGNKYHHISFRDNGIGFAHQDNDRIFEAFQRLHSKSTFAGTGIGLAIVKKVVENHNGIVSAEGVPGVGATFHVYLPVVRKQGEVRDPGLN
jgi:PAS domain S-box-containing protein